MSKISKMTFYSIVCAVLLLSLNRASVACQVDDFYLTKDGALAASTPEHLTEATGYQGKNEQKKLADMVKNGMVIRLKDNIKVQAIERSVEYKMLKIKFLDDAAFYWVTDGSLKHIKCN